ncbi:endo-1,4-beta-xylanase [Treponema bryantii]|uniref:endo-1,4-beta-xylanase n=1 Tax=Treponema bryantii TaxID=163 RepID=UPI002B281FA1|nr:hypothetical protein TRBR_16590 [Treponema bryantii]
MKKNKITLLCMIFVFVMTVNCTFAASNSTVTSKDWLDPSVPSFSKTYEKYFEHVGFAVEYGNFGNGWGTKQELYYDEVQKGLSKHANQITMGNEFKPQFVMAWWGNKPTVSGSFTASNGVTIKTPVLNGLQRIDDILAICKKNNLKMRGHTLGWHSQTEDGFFCKDYDKSKALVSRDEMEARLEWYIKTVLERVDNWEKKNNNGQHIIWAWDVFNEATPDGGSSWLRTDSKWYSVYKNGDFLVDAFKYANKYAPKDVKLVYNDYGGIYGTSVSDKHAKQLRVVDLILSHKDDATLPTRLDAMGLQSHHSVKNSAGAVEKEITDFLAKGIDVQITELDIGTWNSYDKEKDIVGVSGKQFNSLSDAYKAYFQVYIKNRKTASKHGVESITVWGLNDENTWLNMEYQKKWLGNCNQFPLLFTKPNSNKWVYYTKPAFYAVIEAAN